MTGKTDIPGMTHMTDCLEIIRAAINRVRHHKHLPELAHVTAETRLREDAALDSMDLAEFTVVLEMETGVDVFADSAVRTVGEVQLKLERRKCA